MKIKRAQIWIETVIYTLIGLTLIAILLSIAVPQIDEMQDKAFIKQMISALNLLDDEISNIRESPANVRIFELKIGKGSLEINSSGNAIIYRLENTRLEFTQSGEKIEEGALEIQTEKKGSRFNIIITGDYSDILNLTYDNEEKTKILQKSSTPYHLQIENLDGEDILTNSKTNVNFNLI